MNAPQRDLGAHPGSDVVAAASILRGGRVAEEYRTLRAVIEAAGPRVAVAGTPAALVVLVAGVDCAVADVGIRLAAAFADGGRATVLVDADLHTAGRSRPLRASGMPPVGLTEWLRGALVESAFPAYPSGLVNLSILPAGTATSAGDDPFGSERLPALFGALRRERERAVVVSAPLAQTADALFLAPYVDGVLLVVTPGKTPGPTALRARDALQATGARLYGVVLGEGETR